MVTISPSLKSSSEAFDGLISTQVSQTAVDIGSGIP